MSCGGGLEYIHLSPTSSNRGQTWNPVPSGITETVSDETVNYGHGSWATPTKDLLQRKLQTRPLVRERAPLWNQEIFRSREEKEKSVVMKLQLDATSKRNGSSRTTPKFVLLELVIIVEDLL
jgi:hypothetical protein